MMRKTMNEKKKANASRTPTMTMIREKLDESTKKQKKLKEVKEASVAHSQKHGG